MQRNDAQTHSSNNERNDTQNNARNDTRNDACNNARNDTHNDACNNVKETKTKPETCSKPTKKQELSTNSSRNAKNDTKK